MKVIISIPFLIAICILASNCKPKVNCISSGGGKGGTGIIHITPTHGNYYIDSCMIYIKYGSLNEPGDGIYDDSQKCVLIDTLPVVTFDSLKPGLYYFYGNGYHVGFSPPYVKGAANYTMCTDHEVSLYLPTDSYNP